MREVARRVGGCNTAREHPQSLRDSPLKGAVSGFSTSEVHFVVHPLRHDRFQGEKP